MNETEKQIAEKILEEMKVADSRARFHLLTQYESLLECAGKRVKMERDEEALTSK